MRVLGEYFAPENPGPRSSSTFDAPDGDGYQVPPPGNAIIAIGLALDGASEAQVPAATVAYRTEGGAKGEVTTDMRMRLVEAGADCS